MDAGTCPCGARDGAPQGLSATDAFLKKNPSFVQPTCDALSFCFIERPYDEVVAHIEAGRYAKTFVARADALVSLLCDHGLLQPRIYVDGSPYDGSFDDLASDESVGLDAEVSCTLQGTDAGDRLARCLAPARRLRDLMEDDPASARTYRRVLELASAEGGCGKARIEKVLREEGLLPIDERTGLASVFPSYYLDGLERAGGLVWDSTWKATGEGRELLAG